MKFDIIEDAFIICSFYLNRKQLFEDIKNEKV
jgi:hypothetical protein